MPPAALALVLVAALCHAGWNLVAKRAGGGSHFVLANSLAVAVLWALPAAWTAAQTGSAAVGRGVGDWGVVEWGAVAASGALHLAYFNALLRGYREADLTVVYPVARGSGPLLASIGAVLVLGERPSAAGALGALAVVAGVFLLAGGTRLWRTASDPGEARRVRRGVAWGVATGCCIAAYTLVDGYAVTALWLAPLLVDYFGNLLRAAAMLPFAWRDRVGFAAAWRAQWRAVLVVAALGPLSYLLVLHAMRMAPLGHVAPAREVSTLFAALLGGRLLGEGDLRLRLAGAASIAAGVAALALG